MKKKRDIFADLTEGFDALKLQREGKLTPRTFKVESKPAPVLSPQDVVGVREQLRLSRPAFARCLRTNPRTLENWEQDRAKPQTQRLSGATDPHGGTVSGYGAKAGGGLSLKLPKCENQSLENRLIQEWRGTMKLEHTVEVSSTNTVGGFVIDLVKLSDGRVLSISDDAVVLYENLDHFKSNEPMSDQ